MSGGQCAASEPGAKSKLVPDHSSFDHDVAIVGLGYVGLPTALAFHDAGQRVLGIDVSAQRLADVQSGRVDLLPADHTRLAAALDSSACQFTADVHQLERAAAVIICVPTPVDRRLVPDLSALAGACAAVVALAVPGQTLVLTSTSYVGTTEDILAGPLRARGLRPGDDVFVAFSPERIDPANAEHPHIAVPRVVGGVTARCTEQALDVLGAYGAKLHPVSSAAAAELTKLLENTFRAVNIAFVNEIADVSRALGLDIREVIDAAATKPYGFMPFRPGPGVGGHCIPCDPHYLLWQLRGDRVSAPLTEQAMNAIAARPQRVVDRVREALSEIGLPLRAARVLVVGVAYKPDVTDVRESPAVEIIQRLERAGARVSYHDPLVRELRLPDGRALHSVPVPAVCESDLVLVHTLHRDLDPACFDDGRLVLDATYRLRGLTGQVVL
jgi:UDP-N-acetyl-D-glucosamine dehydrogenase